MKKKIGFALIYFFTFHFVYASAELKLTDPAESFNPSAFITYLEDSTNNISISEFINSELDRNLIHNQQRTINLGANENSYWFKFELLNQTQEEHWFFEIDYPTLNSVEIYVYDSENHPDTIIYSGLDYKPSGVSHFSYSIFHQLHLLKNEK